MNNKQGKIAIYFVLLVVVILLVGFAMAAKGGGARKAKPECNDKIDNDGDGDKDMSDGGCSSRQDNDETNCGDGVCEGGETSGTCSADCGVPDSCSDTDGGNVIGTFGTASGYLNNNPYSDDDYCVDTSNIMEYYCSGAYESSQQQSCGTDSYGDNYCIGDDVYKDFTDYFCGSGECDSSTTPELQEECTYGCTNGVCDSAPADSCGDTDGGWNTATQGTVSGYNSGSPYSHTDYCLGGNSTMLTEHYCSGSQWYSGSWDCAGNTTTTCSSGACV